MITVHTRARWIAPLALAACLQVIGGAQEVQTLSEAVRRADTAAVQRMIAQRVDVNRREADGSTPLLWATYVGNSEAVTLLLKAGADPNTANINGVTPLYQASARGDAVIVGRLLKAGAKVNTPVQLGETPLLAAAMTDSIETVRMLLAKGAGVNDKDGAHQQTPLIRAVARGHVSIAKVLIEAGADVASPTAPSPLPQHNERRDNNGYVVGHSTGGLTPLMLAARNGDRAMTELLLQSGAKKTLNYQNPDGVGALMISIINNNFDLAAVLLATGADPKDGSLYQAIDTHNLGVWEPLLDTSRPLISPTNNTRGALDIARLLLEKGADPNEHYTKVLYVEGNSNQGVVSSMPLLRAMRARDVEAVRLLLEFGADPNKTPPTPASTGRADDAFVPRTSTPLFTAIAGGDGAKFGVGANITKEAEQPKVYRFPAERNLARVASLVIAAGAAVNATDEQGATALHLAARAGDDDLVKVLVSHGANLKATDKEGLTALDYAEGKVGSSRPRRARAGAPQVHESTAQLLRQLLNSATPQ